MVSVEFVIGRLAVTQTSYHNGPTDAGAVGPGGTLAPSNSAAVQVPWYYPGVIGQQYAPATGMTGDVRSPYHIRDWTTGIEKPSFEVSKPWLNVHQHP